MTVEVRSYIRPPCGELCIVVACANLPIALRCHVINQSAIVPCERVGVDAVVLPVRAYRAGIDAIDWCRGRRCTGNACRAYTEGNIGFGSTNRVAYHTYHVVDLLTSPVSARELGPRCGIVTVIITILIAGLVEVIVEDYTIDIVMSDEVGHYRCDAFLDLGQTRVEDIISSTIDEPLGVRVGIIVRQFAVSILRC